MSRPHSRRVFLGRAGLLSAASALTLVAGCDDKPDGDAAPSDCDGDQDARRAADAELLREAARLEETAIRVYQAAAALPFIAAAEQIVGTAGRFLGHHTGHRDRLVALVEQLGGEPVSFDGLELPELPAAVTDEALPDPERALAVVRFARDFELSAAQLYYQMVTSRLQTDAARKTIADIMPVEAQHVAVYDFLIDGQTPAPTAFLAEQA